MDLISRGIRDSVLQRIYDQSQFDKARTLIGCFPVHARLNLPSELYVDPDELAQGAPLTRLYNELFVLLAFQPPNCSQSSSNR